MKAVNSLHFLSTAAAFAAIWLLWSGQYTPLVLVLGALSCVLVAWLALRVGFVEVGIYVTRRAFTLMPFWSWLLKEIALANVAVARIIVKPRLSIESVIVTIDSSRLSAVSQAILANSITLTPGTLSVDVDDGRIEVHCLNRSAAEQLLTGAMIRRVAALN